MTKTAKMFVLLLALVASTGVIRAAQEATTVQIGTLYYNLDATTLTAEVTKNPVKYSGSITIPTTVEYAAQTYTVTGIGEGAFGNCTGLTTVDIPNGVTYLGWNAFNGCGITSVTIPESVASLGLGGTFQNCNSLRSVQWNAVNCTIDPYLIESDGALKFYDPFDNLSNLISFTFGDMVEVLPSNLCAGIKGITSVTVPANVTSISYGATFQRCSGLKSVRWNARRCTIKEFKEGWWYPPFKDLSNITSFVFADDVEIVTPSLCNGLTGLKSISMPATVTSIGNIAFRGCTGFTSVTIPENVEEILGGAFRDCSNLTSITIPKKVKFIGIRGFRDCTGLTFVAAEPLTPPALDEDVFYGVNKSIPLYVQCAAVKAYKAAAQWQDFKIDDCAAAVIEQDCSQNGIKESLLQPGSPLSTTTYTLTLYAEGCNTHNEYTCSQGQEVPITAIADSCHRFKQWTDGNTDNPRTVTITGNTAYTAVFEKRVTEVTNAAVTIQDACADDDSLYMQIAYTYDAKATYSVAFDAKGVGQGFLPNYAGTLETSPATVAIALPKDPSNPRYFVRPDTYSVDVSVLDECGSPYTLTAQTVTVRYPSWVILQRWNDILTLRNEDYNGGYTFSAIRWFHEGTPLEGSGDNGSYVYQVPSLAFGEAYWAELTRADDGVTMTTCPFYPTAMTEGMKVGDAIVPYVTVTPTVLSKDNMTIKAETNICGTCCIYTTEGTLLNRLPFCPSSAELSFTIDLSPYYTGAGTFILTFCGIEGTKVTTKVIVKP